MRVYIVLVGSLIIAFLQSCAYEAFNPNEWAVDPLLELSESGLVFNAAINQDTIKVTTNYNTFDVNCEDSWCSIEPNIADSTIAIAVEPNMRAEQRKTTINITVGRGVKILTKAISVVQMGGYWDVVDQFSVYWNSDVTQSQKETISDILSNMVYVKGGSFVMGDNGIYGDFPHNVTLSDYFINKTEVTQKQWNVIMGSNNSSFKGESLPVENITWDEALEYVSYLSKLTNINFALPTEAQWEYAARGGIYSMGFLYPGSNDYTDVLAYKGDTGPSDPYFTTYPVGQFLPNELGIFNMAGNVSEMCSDWYGDYSLLDQDDPMGPATGKYHVTRGGDISSHYYVFCTVYARMPLITIHGNYIGIRLCIRP